MKKPAKEIVAGESVQLTSGDGAVKTFKPTEVQLRSDGLVRFILTRDVYTEYDGRWERRTEVLAEVPGDTLLEVFDW